MKKCKKKKNVVVVIPKEYTPMIDLSYYDISDVIRAEYDPYMHLLKEIIGVLKVNIKAGTIMFETNKGGKTFMLLLDDWEKKYKELEKKVEAIANEYKGTKK